MDNITHATTIAKNIYHFHNDKLAMKYYDSSIDHRKIISSLLITDEQALDWGVHPILTKNFTHEMPWWKYIVEQYIINFKKKSFLQYLEEQYLLSNFPDEYLIWFATKPTEQEIKYFSIEALTQHVLKFL